MRIAIVTDTFPPDVNGVAMTLERLTAGLIARGHEVEVIHPGIREPERRSGGFAEVCVLGFPLPRYPFARLGMPRPVYLRRRWREQRPDVIYTATEGLLALSAVHAARGLGIPVVSGYHTHFPQYLSGYRLGLLEPMMVRYLRRLHNSTSCTLVPTRETERELRVLGFRNLEVLERGVDTSLFDPARRSRELRERWGAGPGDVVLLHAGRVAVEKNPALIFEAWETVRRAEPTAKLVMAGDGPLRAQLQAKYPDAVWTGFLTGTDLAEAYASADVLLFPSRTETFGNVLLEGMASGLVTISYHMAASRRFIEPGINGYAASAPLDDAFLLQTLRALRERRRWPRLSSAARAAVAGQSWGHITARFETLLLRSSGAGLSPAGAAA